MHFNQKTLKTIFGSALQKNSLQKQKIHSTEQNCVILHVRTDKKLTVFFSSLLEKNITKHEHYLVTEV